MMKARFERRMLEGWALRSRSQSAIIRPETRQALIGLCNHFSDTSLIGRGAGNSLGDAALNGKGGVAEFGGLSGILDFDTKQGIITCEPGITMTALQAIVVPKGWFLPVVPGASQATVGGCVCFDVHGKNHEKQGTFGKNIVAIRVLTADGNVRSCSPATDQMLFWATVGGMGLTGLVLAVTLQLIPIETAFMAVLTRKTRNLEETFKAQEKSITDDYSVTWLDTTAGGNSIGRGIVLNAGHAGLAELRPAQRTIALVWPDVRSRDIPFLPKRGLFQPLFVHAFNSLYYMKQRPVRRIQSAHPFLFPLHGINNINRFYGKNGFFEYQIAVPDATAFALVHEMLSEVQRLRAGSFLTVLKRFGPHNPAPMSFPISGITLSMQILANDPEIPRMLDRFDIKTAEAGGRVYLAKDSRLMPEMVDQMYPQRKIWAAYLDQLDPNHVFASDMSRRLGLRNT